MNLKIINSSSRFYKEFLKVICSLVEAVTVKNNKRLKIEILCNNLPETLKNICMSISSRDYENSVAMYTMQCLTGPVKIDNYNQKIINEFLLNPEILCWLRKAKSRYYEFFISLVGLKERNNFSMMLYGNMNVRFSDIRYELSLHGKEYIKERGLFCDRISEWTQIYDKIRLPFLTKEILWKQFRTYNISQDAGLFQALRDITPYYFLRKMQLPNLLDFNRLLRVLKQIPKDSFPLTTFEFGCGSADLSIYLAKNGANVSICDVKGGNIEPARKHFLLRSLKVNCIESTPSNPIPSVDGPFDLIMAVEVLEHIRNPFKLLELIDKCLSDNGVVLLGSFPFVDTITGGDHLKEAVSQRTELKKWINSHWTLLTVNGVGNCFSKG